MTRKEWLYVVDKIDDKYISELADYQLKRKQANEKKSSGKEIVTLKPQYVKIEPSSKFPFRKAAIAVAAVVCVAAAGIFIRANNKPQTSLPNDSTGVSSDNNSGASDNIENLEKLAGEIYISYDRSEYENVTAPKRYYADYHKIDREAFLNLFSSEPQYSEESQEYFTDTESGYIREEHLPSKNGNTYLSQISYCTQIGNDYDTIGNQICKKYSTTLEFDFMTFDALREDFPSKTKGIVSGDLQLDVYAIDAESYLKETEYYDRTHQETQHGNSYEKDWNKAGDYYYIKARQAVDGIPISEGLYGDLEKGTMVEGCKINAVYTKNGLEYLYVSNPWRVEKEAPVEGEFIDLRGAEEIIKAANEDLLTSKRYILESVRLVYVPVVKAEGTFLTPAWEFCDHMGAQYPVYTIDAYTGEMIK